MKNDKANSASAQPWVDRFGELPAISESIFAVNPAIPTDFLVQEARCVIDALAEIAGKGTNEPISAAQAWLLEADLRKVEALLGCIESQIARDRLGVVDERRAAA